MTTTLPRFCFHLAEQGNWPSIQRQGLLPASVLMDRNGLSGLEREKIERCRRPERTVLRDGSVIRDNKPLPVTALERCLIGMTPAQWFALLNSKVFFWFDLERLDRQRRACRPHAQVVMVFETASLLAKHAANAAVTPINTGSGLRKPAQRGAQTFVPVAEWNRCRWAAESLMTGRIRRATDSPVELAIGEPMPEAMQLMLAAHHLSFDQTLPVEALMARL